MGHPGMFEVRLSRLITVPPLLAGLIFLVPGLDMLLLHFAIPRPPAGMQVPYYIGALMFFVFGGLITVVTGRRVVSPTLLLRLSPQGISFAEGLFSDRLFHSGWDQYEKSGYGIDSKLLSFVPVSYTGLAITLRPSRNRSFRTNRWTDPGIDFTGSTIYLNRWCMDTSVERSLEEIGRFRPGG